MDYDGEATSQLLVMVFQNRHVRNRNTSCFLLKGIVFSKTKILPLFVPKLYYILSSVEYKCQFLKDILATFFNTVEVNEDPCTKKKKEKKKWSI